MRFKHWFYTAPLRLRSLLRRAQVEQELDEEFRYHLDRQIEEHTAKGMTPEEARHAALRAMGGVEQRKEECRDMRRVNFIENLLQDLRYGTRMLLKNPGFTLIAAVTLALGIGANTAIFSVVNGVLLRPLPYKEAERIMTVWQHNTQSGNEREKVSPGNFLDYRERSQNFEAMAALRPFSFDFTGQGEPETFPAWLVTSGFFEILGVPALHGRTFLPQEYQPGGERVVVMGYGLWQRRFGGDPGLVGQQLVLDGKPATVVGIMPPEFQFVVKRGMISPVVFSESERRRRSATYLDVIGRLKPGVSLGQARAEMSAIAGHLAQEYPQTNREMGATLVPLPDQLLGQARPALLVLLGAVGFVLLIACANVANLMLVRGAEREREFAIRSALGAARLRLLRQLLTESLALAFLGGVGGVLLARWGLALILALSPANLPRAEQISLDGSVLAFALGVSALTALIFGLFPAVQFLRPDLQESLKEGGRGATSGAVRHRLRNVLVVSEVALALMLLVGAGLLVRSFVRLLQVDPGFATENALTLQVHIYDLYPKPEQQAAYFEQAMARLAALPGVTAAGGSSAPPFIGEDAIEIDSDFQIEGRPAPPPGQETTAFHSVVTSDYFRAMGVRLLRGRAFTKFDQASAAPVVMLNETMARRYFPGEDPVGKRIIVRRLTQPVAREIIGVVGDVRHEGLDSNPRPELFMHYLQVPFGSMTFIVRTSSDPLPLLPGIKQEVWAVNKNQPFYSVATMEQLVSNSLRERRFNLLLLGSFAAIALGLAGVGIYGLISFSTSQRTHEIGIRMALGAQAGDVLKLIVRQGMALLLIGIAIGLAGAFALTRVMATLLFEVSATDSVTFVSVPLLLAVVALLACWIPARRATKVDPIAALRFE